MTTTDADEVLTATAEALECRLLSSRLVQEHISGDGLISAYETVLEPVDAQQQTQLIYLETAPSVSDRDGVLVFQNSEGDEIAVWLYPRDPALPTLPKVVRPSHTAELHTQYQLWGSAGLPVPATLGWSDEGLIAFSALSGVPAHERVAQLGDAFLSSLTGLIAGYADVPNTRGARASLASRRDWYARRLQRRVPELAENIERLSERIGDVLAQTRLPAPVTVHGDLHLGQVFVDPMRPDTVTGILDIDTAGLGDPADDIGALTAHLLVSALFDEAHGRADAPHYQRLAASWRLRQQRADADVARRADAIAAAHLIAHGLGGFADPAALLDSAAALLAEWGPAT